MTSTKVTWARHQAGDALRTGRLTRPAHCSNCGAADKPMRDGRSSIQAHHHNGYDHPLDVEWLCVSCHNKITPLPYGVKAGAAKADWVLVDAIRARYAAGESYFRIADEIGLHRTTVHRIVTHRSWPESAKPQSMERQDG